MSDALLSSADYLVDRQFGRTSADLCRATSAVYYALFHTLAKMTADFFVGRAGPDRAERAWNHIYRALEHTKIANKCKMEKAARFNTSIVDFADFFLEMQYKREKSDYEYNYDPDENEVRTDIARATVKLRNLYAVEEKHLRAFCVFILIEKHRHEEEEKKRARPRES